MMRDRSCGAGKKEPFGFAIGIFENRCGFPRSEMTPCEMLVLIEHAATRLSTRGR
jgi:hypothetical protein